MTPNLPEVLAQIAEVAGLPAALAIAHAKGGRPCYIPTPERLSGHWLVELVGQEAALAIARRLGGGEIEIPLGPTGSRHRVWQAIHRAIAEGKSAAEVARLAGVHGRTVRRHRNGHSGGQVKPDDRQAKLF